MKRFLIATLLAALCVLPLAAGGQADQKGEAAVTPGFNAAGLPIVKEKVTLTYMTGKHQLNGDITAMELWKRYEQMTNVHMEAEFVASRSWTEKLNLVLASGDLPEVLGNVPDTDVVRYSAQGYFVPMNDLIAKYGPQIQALFQKRPEMKKALTLPDGKIYSLPRVNEFRFRELPDLLSINKAWLDKLGLPVPDTIDQYYAALKAFKQNDANGNGDPNDEIPLSFIFEDVPQNMPWSLFGFFGTLENADHQMVKDGKVIFTPTMSEYKAAVAWMAKLYTEGLIDQEVFTQNVKEYFAKGKGKVSLYGSYFEWFGPTAVGAERFKKEYVVLKPMKGVTGERLWNRYADQYFAGKGWFLITKVNKHPEVTMRWFDGIYEPEFSLEWSRGPWGTALKKNPDGSIEFIDAPKGMNYNEFRFANSPGGATGWSVLNDLYDIIKLDEDSTRKLRVDWPVYKPYLVKEAYPMLYFTQEESERIAILQTDLHSYVQQNKAKWIVGEQDLNKTWPEFQNQLRKMGVEELVRIWQQALDRYNK